jgi:hypothetical protein
MAPLVPELSALPISGTVDGELAERARHARASMSLDAYSHVMPLDEIASEQLQSVLVVETLDRGTRWCGLGVVSRAENAPRRRFRPSQ